MKYKTRLISKESQLAKLKSMLNAAMDEAIFVQSQGTVSSFFISNCLQIQKIFNFLRNLYYHQ